MFLWDFQAHGSNARPVEIQAATRSLKVGWITPLTRAGTLVVNSVAVSAYTDYAHGAAHLLYGPLRAYSALLPGRTGQLPEAVKHPYSWCLDSLLRDTRLGHPLRATA